MYLIFVGCNMCACLGEFDFGGPDWNRTSDLCNVNATL